MRTRAIILKRGSKYDEQRSRAKTGDKSVVMLRATGTDSPYRIQYTLVITIRVEQYLLFAIRSRN